MSTNSKIKRETPPDGQTATIARVRNIQHYRSKLKKLGIHVVGTESMITCLGSKPSNQGSKPTKIELTLQMKDGFICATKRFFGGDEKAEGSKEVDKLMDKFIKDYERFKNL